MPEGRKPTAVEQHHEGAPPGAYVTSGVFRGYDTGRHHFVERLRMARGLLARALDACPPGPVVVYDICSSDGRVVLPVLAGHPRRDETRGFLFELDPDGVRAARASAAQAHLDQVVVVEGDAGTPAPYRGRPRADVVVVSGVFVHLSAADQARLIAFLRQICGPGARLLWNCGARRGLPGRIRALLAREGFDIEAREHVRWFRWGGPIRHELGLARLARAPEPFTADSRVFGFQPDFWRRHPRLHAVARPLVRMARRLTAPVGKNPRHVEVSAARGGAVMGDSDRNPANQA